MAVNAALTAQLRSLSDSVGQTDTDIASLLDKLVDEIQHAISSYLGFTLTLMINGLPVTLTVMQSASTNLDVAASVAIVPLTALCETEAGSAMTLYASDPGAFVDLAADITFTLGIDLDRITLAENLPLPRDDPTMTGFAEMIQVNQAIGVLIGRGHTLASAEAELHRLTSQHQTTLPVTAQSVINSTARQPPDGVGAVDLAGTADR